MYKKGKLIFSIAMKLNHQSVISNQQQQYWSMFSSYLNNFYEWEELSIWSVGHNS